MLAWFAGCMVRPIYGENGMLTWSEIKKRIAPGIYYKAQTGLVSWRTRTTSPEARFSRRRSLTTFAIAPMKQVPVHLDGAHSLTLPPR